MTRPVVLVSTLAAALCSLTVNTCASSTADAGSSASAAISPAPAGFDQPTRHNGPRLVGVLVANQEIGTLEVLGEAGDLLIPIEDFVRLTGCTASPTDAGLRISTPLGDVDLGADEISKVDGKEFLSQSVLADRFATGVDFNLARFALELDLPWRPDEEEEMPPPPTQRPDFRPPASSLAMMRIDLAYSQYSGASRLSADVMGGGRLAHGWWNVRARSDFESNHRLDEYSWRRHFEQSMVLAGYQRVSLHPLLRSLQYTGAQYAWTNHPTRLFQRTTDARELLPRQMQPAPTFVGNGPPGGMAELRIDGITKARQVIGLDGRFEFDSILLPARQLMPVEVFLYDRHNLEIPVEVIDLSRNFSDLLLGGGTHAFMGALGLDGNLVYESGASRNDSGFAGFAQWRHGVSDQLTVEATIQRSREHEQLVGGLVASIARGFVAAISAGSTGSHHGYDLNLEGSLPRWRVLARSRITQSGYMGPQTQGISDHLAEVGYRAHPRLWVTLYGRKYDFGTLTGDFLLPGIQWNPTRSTSMMVRPDAVGDYRLELRQYFGRGVRGSLIHKNDRSAIEVSTPLWRYSTLYVGSRFGGDQATIHSANLSWRQNTRLQPSWMAGIYNTDQRWGYELGVHAQLGPGFQGRARIRSDAAPDEFTDFRREQLFVGLTADLAFARGRFVPARISAFGNGRGALAGKISVLGAGDMAAFDLSGVQLRVNGRPAQTSVSGGSFFIGNLEPGLYRINLDADGLPIELMPMETTYVIEIGDSAVTRVDFSVRPEYGVAGRITDLSGTALPSIQIEILDSRGGVIGQCFTDRFGLFRLDGLQVGTYAIRPAATGFEDRSDQLPVRTIEIRDDFLFAQDLELPFTVDGAS